MAYVSVVPENRIGDAALRSLSAYGVNVSRVIRTPERLGTCYMEFGASQRGNQVVYDRAWSAASLASHKDFHWDDLLRGVGTFYLSGITPAVSSELAIASEEALRACRERGIETVLDLNYRGKLWTPEQAQQVMGRLMSLVDVCIANDEDAPASLGIRNASGSLAHGIEELDAYRATAHKIYERYGCTTVGSVVHDVSSVEGARRMGLLCQDGRIVESPIYDVHVLEGVGPGDAFAAGLLHVRLHGFDLQKTVDYATAASVLKLARKGDFSFVTSEKIGALASSGSTGRRVSR